MIEMKKRILFVIHALDAGGAQKSLVSLVNSLPRDSFDIDLMIFNKKGLFCDLIPDSVHVLEASAEQKCMSYSFCSLDFWKHFSFSILFWRLVRLFRIGYDSSQNINQYVWSVDKHVIPCLSGQYDVAIGYLQGRCNYFVIDKVKAKKKILWVHHDYTELQDFRSFDDSYFSKADYVATVSSVCKQSLENNFPNIDSNKFIVVDNITSKTLIYKQKEQIPEDEYFNDSRFKILSLGRLHPVKGYDMAVDAAKFLKDKGCDFCWYIIGDGDERNSLESRIKELGLTDNFKLIGLRANPYPYIDKADAFCVTSHFEGKSIAIDEAKILAKPIVCTKFPSSIDVLEDGVNSILVNQDSKSIAEGILKLYEDKGLCTYFSKNLKSSVISNEESVVKQIISLM